MISALDELAAAQRATISVWMGGLDGAVWLSRDADAVHHPASTVKLPLLVALYRAADSGQLDLDEQIPVRDTLLSVVPGQTYQTTQDYDQDDEVWDRLGSTASLRWLGERAIIRSSNLATNLLIDRLGVDAVNTVFATFGTPASQLARGIQDAPAGDAGLDNTATAADLAAILRAVADRTAASPAACEQIEAVLARCEDNDGLPAGLPNGCYVAHKPGWIDEVCHDVGIV
ncbi:MAG: serine hydrolase, partial [Nocardioidaceae bacterium]|nr:serine hydrolase [Nocardioidaceae bacterium]